jgi:hypothetical protein
MNPVHILPFFLFKIYFNIIPPSVSRSSKWSVSFTFSLHAFHLYCNAWYLPRSSHALRLEYPNNIWRRVQIMNLLVMYFPPAPCYVSPLRSKCCSQELSAKAAGHHGVSCRTHCRPPDVIKENVENILLRQLRTEECRYTESTLWRWTLLSWKFWCLSTSLHGIISKRTVLLSDKSRFEAGWGFGT